MTNILQSPPLFPSSSSSITCVSPTDNDGFHQETYLNNTLISSSSSHRVALYSEHTEGVQEGDICGNGRQRKRREREEGDQLSLLAVLVTVFRKSWAACRSERVEEFSSSSAAATMEIGRPTNVRHVAHVTFDRFNGFLGLPVEFEPEVPRRPPSASASVFGVSTESMQLSFDSRDNSVPTILLMMQRCLYVQGGLQTEGIFRINAENGQEEYVREQLNRGIVPDDIDVHCLAGLIKAWFRELPRGILDTLSPELVMQAQTEDECTQLVRQLPPTEAALLDWAINLMADVAELEHFNKMNARNIAMVFAPNMTKMADPLTALMYAVQVMNFLKTLIVRTLKEREDSLVDLCPRLNSGPDDDDRRHSSLQSIMEINEDNEASATTEPFPRSLYCPTLAEPKDEKEHFLTSIENIIPDGKNHLADNCNGYVPDEDDSTKGGSEGGDSDGTTKGTQSKYHKIKIVRLSNSILKNGIKNSCKPVINVIGPIERTKETSIFSRLNSRSERVEAWL